MFQPPHITLFITLCCSGDRAATPKNLVQFLKGFAVVAKPLICAKRSLTGAGKKVQLAFTMVVDLTKG